MNSDIKLHVIPKFSLKPNKFAYYNEVAKFRVTPSGSVLIPRSSGAGAPVKLFHNFVLSSSAQRNLREKINWLYQLARSKTVKSYSGKVINNFKINFITLTLPSEQVHPTAQITHECFNQFLTEIRQRTKMENYVWRLEFQKNGNVHYHIVSDTYVDYFFARDIWNRILNKLGYVDKFVSKMESMSLMEYYKEYSTPQNNDFQYFAKRYAKGKSEGWKKPPSVDVVSCTSDKSISLYISKYFSKNGKDKVKSNPLDNEENSFSLRLWFCSRSLSKLKSITDYFEASHFNPRVFLDNAKSVFQVLHPYCEVVFFEFRQLVPWAKGLLQKMFYDYAKSLNYSPG